MSSETGADTPRAAARRWLWFIALWVGSVAALGAVASILRWAIDATGLVRGG